MTRDDAIKLIARDRHARLFEHKAISELEAAVFIDSLVALGVLKLDDGAVRSETIDRAIEMIGGIADRVAAGEPATTAFVNEWCRKQNAAPVRRSPSKRWLDEAMRIYGSNLGGAREHVKVATALAEIADALCHPVMNVEIDVWLVGPEPESVGRAMNDAEKGEPLKVALDSARCEPPPEHRGKRWHWVATPGNLFVKAWRNGIWTDAAGDWSVDQMTAGRWRYIAPCEEPRAAHPINQHAKGEPS